MVRQDIRILSSALGCASVVGLVFTWLVVLAPVKANLRYFGGGLWATLTMLGCIAMSFGAGWLGSRSWYILTIVALITFVYVGFLIRSPYWF